MKYLILTAVFVIGMMTAAYSQIAVISRNLTVTQYSESTGKWVDKSSRESKNYITWKDGELTIVCSDCETKVFKYMITRKVSEDVKTSSRGFHG